MNPYPGLRPFESSEKDLFFGREEECAILVDQILAHRLTLLFAASGAGKTSLLRAAVLPRLTDPEGEHLQVVIYREWVEDPLAGLTQAVLDRLNSSGRVPISNSGDFLQTDLRSASLIELCELYGLLAHPPLVLILDQFEEFFRYQRGAPNYFPFLKELGSLITLRELPVSVVLSMREDFALELNALKPFVPSPLFGNYFRLERLSPERARQAIEVPALIANGRVEPQLVEALLADLAEPHGEGWQAGSPVRGRPSIEPPYLQIVCFELWKLEPPADQPKILRLLTYEARGRSKGLLEGYVARVLDSLTSKEKSLASRAFEHLITRRGTKMAYTAGDLAVAIGADEKSVEDLLSRLEEKAILRVQERQGLLWYELHHDLFSPFVEAWNGPYKARQRRRRLSWTIAVCLISAVLLPLSYDVALNKSTYHLRLDFRSGSDQAIEVFRGRPGSLDLLHSRGYLAESGIERAEIEPIRVFETRILQGLETAELEPALFLRTRAHLQAPWRAGYAKETFRLAAAAISENNMEISGPIALRVSLLGSLDSVDLLKLELNEASSPATRKTIVEALGRTRAVQAAIFLEELLANEDPDIRGAIATALGTLRFQRSVRILIGLLDDPDPSVQESAVKSLGLVGDETAINPLVSVLSNQTGTTPAVRQSTIASLASLGGTVAADAVVRALDDPARGVKVAAAQWAGKVKGGSVSKILLAKIKSPEADKRWWAASAMASVNQPEVVQPLIEHLKDSNSVVRWTAASSLGSLQTKKAVVPLLEALHDRDWAVRVAAVTALKSTQSSAAIRPALRLLNDPIPSVRREATALLGIVGNSDQVNILTQSLVDPVSDVRTTAAFTLATLGDPETLGPIIDSLNRADEMTKVNIISALGRFSDARAIATLVELLDDPKQEVRRSANHALISLGRPDLARPAAAWADEGLGLFYENFSGPIADSEMTKKMAAWVETLSSAKNYWERQNSAMLLARLGNPAAIPPLMEAASDSGSEIKSAVMQSLATIGNSAMSGYLIKNLADEDMASRSSAARTLGNLGEQEAILPLLKLLDDENAMVRLSAALALGRLGATQAIDPLIALLADSPQGMRENALVALGALKATKAHEQLARVYYEEQDRPAYRLAAAVALFALGDRRGEAEIETAARSRLRRDRAQVAYLLGESKAEGGIQFIRLFLQDQDLWLRRAAIDSLAKIGTNACIPLLEPLALNTTSSGRKDANNAIDALRGIGSPEAIAVLQKAARSNEESVGFNVYRSFGDLGAQEAFSQLLDRLKDLETAHRSWLQLRDRDITRLTPEEVRNLAQRIVTEKPRLYLGWPIAYSIARLDREAGIRLLSHDLAKVREGAAYGLAQMAEVSLVERLDKARASDPEYPFTVGAYRAIDLTLRYIEWNGGPQELSELRTLLNKVRDREAVCTRIEFTIQMLDRDNPIKRGTCTSLTPPTTG